MAESIFRAKKTYIMENMQIDNLKKANFWNLSAEYETKFYAIGPEQLKIIKQF